MNQQTISKRGSPGPGAMPRHGTFEISAMLDFADAWALADRFGWTASDLAESDAMVPLPIWHELLEALVDATGDPYFGLHFGASARKSGFKQRVGALGLMLLSSPSMAAGVSAVVRYQNFFNEGDRYAVVEQGLDTHICFEAWGPERIGQIQMAEKTVAQIIWILALAEPAIEPRAIHFANPQRPGSVALTEVLGVVPSFGASRTVVVVKSDDMQRPIRGGDSDLFRFFDRHLSRGAAGASREVARGSESTASRVTAAVKEALHAGRYSSEAVARKLGIPLRTLQRRLGAEGTGFKEIVEDVRRNRSQRLLESGMSVGEVAVLLGYSSTPPFVRAFRRWFGMSPAAWRDSASIDR